MGLLIVVSLTIHHNIVANLKARRVMDLMMILKKCVSVMTKFFDLKKQFKVFHNLNRLLPMS